jgi:phosphate transport system ATP-binding protein
MPGQRPMVEVTGLDVYYGPEHAIRDVSFWAPAGSVTALIGASGSGKSTLLRALNRLHDATPSARVNGHVRVGDSDIYRTDPIVVRQQVGMVFQRPNPFRTSIFANVAYGLTLRFTDRRAIAERVEESLHTVGLWPEVKDRLKESGLALSGGQQQRLCIARAIATKPDALLMDEPSSSLDPISTAHIEELIMELRGKYCVILVTHSMRQAARISDFTAFLYRGDIIEIGRTSDVFSAPKQRQTEDFIAGTSS